MKKIKWIDKVTNEVLRGLEGKWLFINKIQGYTGNWFGHMVRGRALMSTVLEGTVEGIKKSGCK